LSRYEYWFNRWERVKWSVFFKEVEIGISIGDCWRRRLCSYVERKIVGVRETDVYRGGDVKDILCV